MMPKEDHQAPEGERFLEIGVSRFPKKPGTSAFSGPVVEMLSRRLKCHER